MAEVPKPDKAKSEGSESTAAETKGSNSQSWWLTLPGLLTGVAAVITAVTGLVVGLYQIGALSGDTPKSQTPSGDSATQQSGALPAGMEVKLAGGDLVYKILSARLEPYNTENRALRFTVRLTNNGEYDALLGDESFRLLVDGVPRAPTSLFYEIVAGRSAKEGDVVFEVPTTENEVVLQISEGDDTTEIPFDLTAAET